jgi:hypothetical protein
MAQSGSLSHAGAASRIGNAAPAGYTGTYCENVGYTNRPDVASFIYSEWRRSSTHNACMNDSRMTVAGVGTYQDGAGVWWVTMEFAQVRSSSSSNNSPPTVPVSTPTPQRRAIQRPQAAAPVADEPDDTPEPTPSPTPQPTDTPEPEESPNDDVQALAEESTDPPDEPVLGTREYSALGALLVFAGLVLFLARRRVESR